MNFAARGQAQNAHVASVSAAPDAVVGVEFAGLEVHIGTCMCGRRGCRGRGWGCCGSSGRLVIARGNAHSQTRYGSGVDEPATAHAGGFGTQVFSLIAHGHYLS